MIGPTGPVNGAIAPTPMGGPTGPTWTGEVVRFDAETRQFVFERPSDGRDPDYTRLGIFINHNCWKCQDGRKPCAKGNPNQCEFPRARND